MKTPTFLVGFFLVILDYKTEEKLRFLTKNRPRVEVSPEKKYPEHLRGGG